MSNLSKEFLESYRVRFGLGAFVETGCYRGDGIAAALAAGYGRAFSCDVLAAHAELCRGRFASVEGVRIYEGDSLRFLEAALPGIPEPCFFWLDAHFPAFYEPSFVEDQAVRFPAPFELRKIHELRGGARGDVIAVDDLRVLRSEDNPRHREGEVGGYFAVEGWSLRDLTERFEGTHSAAVLCDQEGVLVLEPLVEPGARASA